MKKIFWVYRRQPDGVKKWEQMKGHSIVLEGADWFKDLGLFWYINKINKSYYIVEPRTGYSCASGRTLDEAKARSVERMLAVGKDRFEEMVMATPSVKIPKPEIKS